MKIFALLNFCRFSLLITTLCLSSIARSANIPLIAATSSLKFPLQEIALAFQQDTGHHIRISYASSGNLTRQIQQGAPFELFLSANHNYIKQLYQQNKTQDEGMIYARGRLVLLNNKQFQIKSDTGLAELKEILTKGTIKHFAIANPKHAPYGFAAREALQQQGLWPLIQPYLVFGENVSQAAQFVSSGAADLGLVSYSLTFAPALQKTTHATLVDAAQHQPLLQTMVLLKGASETTKLFYRFMQQTKARKILTRFGYSTP